MQIGMVGLGRMGAGMVRRLMRGGHECVVHDLDSNAIAQLARDGATGAASLAELASQLKKPRGVVLNVKNKEMVVADMRVNAVFTFHFPELFDQKSRAPQSGAAR